MYLTLVVVIVTTGRRKGRAKTGGIRRSFLAWAKVWQAIAGK
jgi:hypothetical protein